MTGNQNDLRRFGAALLLGVAAGLAARYYFEARTRSGGRPATGLIDWEQARQAALRLSQWEQAPIDNRDFRREQYARMVTLSEPLIAEYLGVQLPEPVSRIFVFDRREWLEANIVSFSQLFRPIEEMYEKNGGSRGALGLLMNDVSSKLLGMQIGGLLGYLAQRVLGQYDLSLLSAETTGGSLYFVEPNIARVQQQLGLSDMDFRLWITLHEMTHAFEFEAYPWVRRYFRELIDQNFALISSQMLSSGNNLVDMLMRLLQGIGSGQHWIEMVLTPEQRAVFDRIQALMSLIEGYGNHVMNAVGRRLLPSFSQIEQRVAQRQKQRTMLDLMIFRLTGLDLKLAQYQQGEAFVNAVVAARGIQFASRVWERPENLPTMDEIRAPTQWIARMDRQ
ncbi:zinc-dependent metalloprotease [Chloroflexus sp. Y-396-1]|uniref:zinc-dependent metalloprotease n=1 Tax=Chloroflexus sp. Y-396-1 TaxID=867845 RepID=UPI000492012F|nr:zinc-dependent metalloprotease [Chloroflexus sp. Y-396-1]